MDVADEDAEISAKEALYGVPQSSPNSDPSSDPSERLGRRASGVPVTILWKLAYVDCEGIPRNEGAVPMDSDEDEDIVLAMCITGSVPDLTLGNRELPDASVGGGVGGSCLPTVR